jgi:hypothetical protein
VVGVIGGLALGVLTACRSRITPSFDSPEPAARTAAVVRAAAEGDRGAIPNLVRMLESDDPATRVLAITALEGMTGDRLGYEPSAGELERGGAIRRWREYVSAGATAPGPAEDASR